MRSWDIYYEGYKIEAIEVKRGRISRIEELRVNGITITTAKIVSSEHYWTTIHAKHCFSNVVREIEIRLAPKARFSICMGIQVFIDGEYIGNDNYTRYPTLAETRKKLEKGFWYFYFNNLLRVVPTLYMTVVLAPIIANVPLTKTLIFIKESIYQFPLSHVLINTILITSIFNMSYSSWNDTKLITKNLLSFEQKWK